ncbi:MAG: type II secretion system F family protein [Gaiellaceae bacterium]
MLLIVGIALLATAAYFIAEAATAPARARNVALRRAADYGRTRLGASEERQLFRDRVLVPFKNRLAGWVLRLSPRTTVESVTAKLLSAGMSRTISPMGFLAAKAAFAVSGIVFGALMGSAFAGLVAAVPFAVFGGFGAFVLPDFVLSARASRRKEQVRADLPDALDLLMVSVEAGLGFDAAIVKLTDHTDGPLAQEFSLTLNEMRMGESRQEALKRMADRVPAPEVAAFARAIIQSDQLGMSLGRILRVQAADSRLRRQAAAEERAMKAPIKMLFPTVLFIFPAMFVVILGPAFLNLSKIF